MSGDPAAAEPRGPLATGPLDNRFYVVSVACLRVLQIRNGARLRVHSNGHKPCLVAVAEVTAGAVPCYLA